jgi:hemoglobin
MRPRLLILCALFAFGCAGAQAHKGAAAPKSLYLRLGGLKGIKAVVDLAVGRIGKDPRVKDYFEGVDVGALKQHFVELTCVGTGGPCEYSGRSMKESHEDLLITNAAFDAVLEDILFSMRKLKVGSDEQGEVLRLLNSMRKDIVELK